MLGADRAWLAEVHQIAYRWPVVTEPFWQWVIEDRFAGARLPLEEIDVIITDDVTPYELLKLRLLNAGRSCIAYLSALEGIDTVDVAMAQDPIRQFVTRFLHDEAAVGGSVRLGALALAGWCEYLRGVDHRGEPITLAADPHLQLAVNHAEQSVDDPAAFLDFVEVFGPDLPAAEPFVDAFVAGLRTLRDSGVPSALERAG